jgi:hypothetical protein
LGLGINSSAEFLRDAPINKFDSDLEKLTEDDVFKLLMFAAREGEAEIIRKIVKFDKFRKWYLFTSSPSRVNSKNAKLNVFSFNWADKNGETAAMKRIANRFRNH